MRAAARFSASALILLLTMLMLLGVGVSALAHEIRPAYLQIESTQDCGCTVLWKQPIRGEVAVPLVPHLSGGWIDGQPDSVQATASFVIPRWKVPAAAQPPLDGQTVWVEGLQSSITDVLIVVRTGATGWQAILTQAIQPSR